MNKNLQSKAIESAEDVLRRMDYLLSGFIVRSHIQIPHRPISPERLKMLLFPDDRVAGYNTRNDEDPSWELECLDLRTRMTKEFLKGKIRLAELARSAIATILLRLQLLKPRKYTDLESLQRILSGEDRESVGK